MELSQALGIINLASPEQTRNLADLIPEALIRKALTSLIPSRCVNANCPLSQ
jgi:hypothetical protein